MKTKKIVKANVTSKEEKKVSCHDGRVLSNYHKHKNKNSFCSNFNFI